MPMGWDYVCEQRPPTGLFFISHVIYDHDSSARDLWQSYQQSNLVAKQVGLAKKINLVYLCFAS
jgi:hypothetical protein